jgi:2-hydroxycyclohexanecarboxyl-CoA dehydrogenase
VYSAAKGGLIAFTKTIARETARHRINVNCVCPGPSDTRCSERVRRAEPKLAESLKRVIPWGRSGSGGYCAGGRVSGLGGRRLYHRADVVVSGGLTMA